MRIDPKPDQERLKDLNKTFSAVTQLRLLDCYAYKGMSFLQMPIKELIKRLDSKLVKLELGIIRKDTPESVALLAADIANYAMFVAAGYFNEQN